jgi:hypothetical protein
LQELENTEATTIKEGILLALGNLEVQCQHVKWLSFDGASNMSGKHNGTQSQMIKYHTKDAVYVHCRSHLLQLKETLLFL